MRNYAGSFRFHLCAKTADSLLTAASLFRTLQTLLCGRPAAPRRVAAAASAEAPSAEAEAAPGVDEALESVCLGHDDASPSETEESFSVSVAVAQAGGKPRAGRAELPSPTDALSRYEWARTAYASAPPKQEKPQLATMLSPVLHGPVPPMPNGSAASAGLRPISLTEVASKANKFWDGRVLFCRVVAEPFTVVRFAHFPNSPSPRETPRKHDERRP